MRLLPIYRYVVPFHVTKTFESNDGKNTKKSEYIGAWLLPFLMCTENTRNTLFCYGLGCLVSLFLVSIELLIGKSVNFRRCFLRPILGGLAAGLLFITIISGGAIIWEGDESVRGYSVGIIAVFASLKCEQLPRLLQRLAARSMPPNSQ